MLARRLRRRPNINPALAQCIVLAGKLKKKYLKLRHKFTGVKVCKKETLSAREPSLDVGIRLLTSKDDHCSERIKNLASNAVQRANSDIKDDFRLIIPLRCPWFIQKYFGAVIVKNP